MGKISKQSFEGVPFKLLIPKINLNSSQIIIESTLLFNGRETSDLVLEYITINKNNNCLSKTFENYCLKQVVSSYRLELNIQRKNKFPIINSELELYFLSGKNFGYSIIYKIIRNNVCQLKEVSIISMSIQEKRRYAKVTSPSNKNKLSDKSLLDLNLDIYQRKLYREFFYLKENGGRKYKVTNGKFVGLAEGMFCYDFELESELIIAEESPILLKLSDYNIKGSVLNSEGFHILLLLENNIGNQISGAFISVEPWRLLEALAQRIKTVKKEEKLALAIIKKKYSVNEKLTLNEIPKGQEKAIQMAINNPITVIWGPPGTGKTYTMSKIAMHFLEKGKTVLMVSHSNVSVDGLVLELDKQIELSSSDELKNMVKSGMILRYGYVRNEVLSQNTKIVSFNYALHQDKKLFSRREKLLLSKKDSEITSDDLIRIEKELKEIKISVKEKEKRCVDRAKLVATTISKTSVDSLFANKTYNVVMFDEASMAYVPHIFSAARFATDHFICVGDFRQLAPIAQSDAKDILEKDIFRYLDIIDDHGEIHFHPWLVMLNVQRRMHPAISEFCRNKIYNQLLENHPDLEMQRNLVNRKGPFKNHPVVFVDLSNTYCLANKNDDNSRFNILSALIAVKIALNAVKSGQSSIGIITPYHAQCRLIQAMIFDLSLGETEAITCSTVHQFQGSERDVIIFDGVESYPLSKPGILMSKNENNSLTRLVNVAISRARGKLIVLANLYYWEQKYKDYGNNMFYQLLSYLKDNSYVIRNNVIEILEGKKSKIEYFNKSTYFMKVSEDIKNVQSNIILSISDSSLNDEEEKRICMELKKQSSLGVSVAVKTADYKLLPSYWKGLSWNTDENLFPLLLIDDSVLWYGVPVSKGAKKDTNRLIFSKIKVYFRITGVKTIEIIKSLTRIEYKICEGFCRPLRPKVQGNKEEKKYSHSTGEGLAAYIRKKERCPKCGAEMQLASGIKGKFFIRCTKCRDIEFLTPKTVNEYIQEFGVKCPVHNCPIHAKLSKNGIYIYCEEGHYVKISEV